MTRRGFSLLEVMIAIALTAALIGSMFAFLWDTLETRERMATHTTRRRSATTVIDRLERDLTMVVASDPDAGVGVEGTESSLRLLVRSVPARLADGARPELALTDLDFRQQRRREFAGLFLSYSTEGQQLYQLVWRRRLHHRELPGGGVLQEC